MQSTGHEKLLQLRDWATSLLAHGLPPFVSRLNARVRPCEPVLHERLHVVQADH
jgi:hypothetical protein